MITHKLALGWLLCATLLLAACAGQREFTPADAVATVYTTVDVVNRNTAGRLDAGLIPVADAQAILAVTKEARGLADAASVALAAGDTGAATGALLLAIALLDALETRAAR